MKKALHLTHLSSLALTLGISLESLLDLANKSQELYKPRVILKKNGEPRPISVPAYKLKIVQQRINQRLLQKIDISENAFGWVKGRSRFMAAKVHQDQLHVSSFDITKFYESIHSLRIYKLLNETLGCSPNVAKILTKLTTHKSCLPQGAPTSQTLANIILSELDSNLSGFAKKRQANLTRFGDDICVSSSTKLANTKFVVEKNLQNKGLKLKKRKTILDINTKKNNIAILGLSVGKTVIIPKKERHLIQSILHNAQKTGLNAQNKSNHHNYRKHLEGRIAQIRLLHPILGEQMIEVLKSISD